MDKLFWNDIGDRLEETRKAEKKKTILSWADDSGEGCKGSLCRLREYASVHDHHISRNVDSKGHFSNIFYEIRTIVLESGIKTILNLGKLYYLDLVNVEIEYLIKKFLGKMWSFDIGSFAYKKEIN